MSALCFTVLYPNMPAQAQMQSKNFDHALPKMEEPAKPKLFVPQSPTTENEQKEIDRVFEKYKLLTEKQNALRDAKPMKNNPVKPKRPSAPTIPQNQQQPPPSNNGFSSILENYNKSKEGRTVVRSKTITPAK